MNELYSKISECDDLEKFKPLVEANYDPNKKLLDKILCKLTHQSLIKIRDLKFAYDLIEKLIKDNNINKNINYNKYIVNIKNYEIAELLVKNKIIYIDENITTLLCGSDKIEILNLLCKYNYNDVICNYYINEKYILSEHDDNIKLFIDNFTNEIPKNLLSNIIFKRFDLDLTKYIVSKCQIDGYLDFYDLQLEYDTWEAKVICSDEKINVVNYLLNVKLLNINDALDYYINKYFNCHCKLSDEKIMAYINFIIDLDHQNIDIEKNLNLYKQKARESGNEYLYNNIIKVINKKANKSYETIMLPRILCTFNDEYIKYTDFQKVMVFESMKKLKLYFYAKFDSIIKNKKVNISNGRMSIGYLGLKRIGTYEIS